MQLFKLIKINEMKKYSYSGALAALEVFFNCLWPVAPVPDSRNGDRIHHMECSTDHAGMLVTKGLELDPSV